MNNFLLWIGGLVTLCLGLLFAGPHFVDWNGYRGVIEEEASRYFGRRVRVGGEVNLRVLPVPYVSFDKLSIADTNSPTGAPLIRADNFKMWLSVPPLLQGVMEAHHVELRRPVIELITNTTGGGNWQNVRLKSGAMRYLPGGFALEALDVIEGQVLLRNASGAEMTRFTDINGTLSAGAIEGPFKFKGGFNWQGQQRTLHLATARPAPNGDVRLKASMTASQKSQRIVLDGIVSARNGRTAFDGDLTANLSAPRAQKQIAKNDAAGSIKPTRSTLASAFDLKSKLVADTTALKLNNINLALQTDGPPQLMTGRATLNWAKDIGLDVDLSSRWIDFDRFTLSAGDVAPLENARQLLIALGRSLPEQADTNVRIAFDQATLGGQALGAIQLAALRKSGPLKLQEFEASVPGGGKIAISGELSVSRKAPGFKGQLSADGQSFLRFLRWGLGDEALAPGLVDGPFSLESGLMLGAESFALTDATADFGDTPLKGALTMQLGEKRSIALDLEGNTIVWNRLSPEPLDVGLARKLLSDDPTGKQDDTGSATHDVSQDAAQTAASPAIGEAQGTSSAHFAGLASRFDLNLKLKALNLIDGDDVYRDFEGMLDVTAGRLSVPILRFVRDSGLELDVAARQVGSERNTITGVIAASSHVAIAELLQFLEARDLDPVLRQRLSALAPLRVASVIKLGRAERPATEMRFDGRARGGRLVATADFSKGLSVWRKEPVTVSATIENDRAERLFSLISDSRTFARNRLGRDRSGRFFVKAAGTPSEGLLMRAVIESDGLDLNYYGDFRLKQGSPFAFDGQVDFDAESVREAMALVGFELGEGAGSQPIKGRFDVVRKDATLRLKANDVVISGSRVSGLVSLTEQTNAPSKLVAKLAVDNATLSGVMRSILAPEKIKASDASSSQPSVPRPILLRSKTRRGLVRKAAMTPGEGEEDKGSLGARTPASTPEIWPKEHFDLSPLTNMEGYVTATFDTFAFDSDGALALNDARLEAAVAPGRVSVTKLTGAALGGVTDIAFDIKKAPAGVDLNGTLKMQIGKAPKPKGVTPKGKDKTPSEAGEPSARVAYQYAAVFDLAYAGRAFAPQGLAADLDGEGKLVLADASLTGLTAKEVRQSAAETMREQGPVTTEVFVAGLREKLRQGQIELGSLNIPVRLKDGAVTMAPIEIEGADGTTTFSSSLEVAAMKFDSEWNIAAREPAAKPGDTGKTTLLPPVTVLYAGDLSAVATVEPRISSGALEREIAVRKMERDVAELERLRKLDETRAKEEEARRKELERSLAEQRRLQAERERKLLLEQQQQSSQIGPDGLPVESRAGGDPSLTDPDAVQRQEPDAKPRRRTRKRRPPPPKKDVWNPFQITPY